MSYEVGTNLYNNFIPNFDSSFLISNVDGVKGSFFYYYYDRWNCELEPNSAPGFKKFNYKRLAKIF